MATIPVNQPVGGTGTGANTTYYSIVAGGDTFLNDGKTLLLIRNTGSNVTVNVTPQKLINGLTIQAESLVVGSSADGRLGPFDPSIFNTAAGAAVLTYSGGTATTTIAPVSL